MVYLYIAMIFIFFGCDSIGNKKIYKSMLKERNKPPPPNKGNILYLPERAINFPVTVVEQMIPNVRDIRNA